MTEVYVVRHGESKHNRKELIQGQVDSELTERGRRQAEALGEKLDESDFDRVYSSDLSRAMETAEIVTGGWNTEVAVDENLRERDYGVLHDEGFEKWEEVDAEDHHEWSPEDGESLKDHKRRASSFLEKVRESDKGDVLVFAHGGTVAAMVAWILNCESRQSWRLHLDNCSVSVFENLPEGWIVRGLNQEP